jgi:hypothetical protein
MWSTRLAALLAVLPVYSPAYSQDLAPRAYVITPTGSHAVIFSSSFSSGQVLIDPTAPVEDAKGSFQVPLLGYYQSFDLLGHSSNVAVVLPYARGDFSATVNGSPVQAYRSGMADVRVRVAVNLSGAPAMNVDEYLKWHEKHLIGVSLTLSIPTGQYDSARLVNTGVNRWGFKPEIGFTRRWRHWVADWYLGAWFFTANHAYFPGASTRMQNPVGSVEGHLGYYVRPRLWISADANFWAGNRSMIDHVDKRDGQRNSRVGTTVSIPVSRRHAAKFSYSQGAYVTRGGDYRTMTLAWQYSWISPPR